MLPLLANLSGSILLVPESGRPPVFITHGTRDRVLPITRCSRQIVPQLQRAGYAVRYRELNGPNIVPPHLMLGAMRWFTTTQVHTHQW